MLSRHPGHPQSAHGTGIRHPAAKSHFTKAINGRLKAFFNKSQPNISVLLKMLRCAAHAVLLAEQTAGPVSLAQAFDIFTTRHSAVWVGPAGWVLQRSS
jgi:hypothetical protein